VNANYIQLRDNDNNKGESIYIERRPKELGNIARFINNTQPETTNILVYNILEYFHRLPDTSKAANVRLEKHGKHKLG